MTDKKGSLRNRLSASIQSEGKKLDERFAAADSIMLPKPQPKPLITATNTQKALKVTFTFNDTDIDLLEQLVTRSALLGKITNKSEMLRAGLQSLITQNEKDFIRIIDGVEKMKKGKPQSS